MSDRPRLIGTIAGLLILVAACGGNGTPSPAAISPGASAVSTATAGSPATSPAASGPAAADRLSAAFGAMPAGYTFDSTITVGATVATHATGRWVRGSSEFVIESSGISITYRTIPPLAWVLKPGADWVVVDGAIPGGDPLDSLSAPKSTMVSAEDAAGLHLVGTYAAKDLGLTGTGTVPVALLLATDGTITATYTADVAGGTATSVVVLHPSADVAPVVAPSQSAKP